MAKRSVSPQQPHPINGGDLRPGSVSYVLVAYSEPWRADQMAQLIENLAPRTRVIQVHDGHSALAACRRQTPGLLIADGELDELDGFSLLAQLRQAASTRLLPCILISQRLDAHSVRAARPLRPHAYLGKPCDLDELQRRLLTLLPRAPRGLHTQADTPGPDLDAFLERMRNNNRGAPMLEAVQIAIQECLSADDKDLGVIEAQLSKDPQVTARLIQLANSAAQHQASICQSLSQALPRLGLKRALNLVLAMALQHSAILGDERLSRRAATICAKAQRAAQLAEWLARKARLDVELCYTAGLLHNIGELALLRTLQDWLDSGEALDEERVESVLSGYAAGFGSALRSRWALPLQLRQATSAFYGLGADVFSREALVLNLAGTLMRLPPDRTPDSLRDERTVRLLRLDAAILDEVASAVPAAG